MPDQNRNQGNQGKNNPQDRMQQGDRNKQQQQDKNRQNQNPQDKGRGDTNKGW